MSSDSRAVQLLGAGEGRDLPKTREALKGAGPPLKLSQSQAKVEELESLRGLAALLVVFFHIPKWDPFLDVGIINNGYLMVDLFFVLSGFVIYTAYNEKISSSRDLLRFQFLRFGRLYPVHLTFLLAFASIEIARYYAQQLGIPDIRSAPFEANNLEALVHQLFLIHGVLPGNYALTYNGPAWSISVEFYTYLVFGVALLSFKHANTYFFGFLAFASLLMITTETTLGLGNLLRGFAGFSIGCLTAKAVKDSRLEVPDYLPLLIFISIILFLQLKTPYILDAPIYFLSAALIASLMLSKRGLLKQILRLKILRWLGLISYSVYMSHGFVEWGIGTVFKHILKRPETLTSNGNYILELSTVETILACTFIVVSVLAVSQLTYTLLEKPFREKSRLIAFSKLS